MTHAPPTDTLVSVRDLQKTYGKGSFFGSKFHALRGVSLEVGRGTVFGLLGPNGAGKTTMIKILLGLVRRFEGEATLFGRHPDDPASRMRVGYLPEAHRLPSYLTGRQMLELSGMHSGRSLGWVRERMPDWLDRVGMTAAADRKIRTYSKGMQQRIGLAQAMIHEPELLFLDEPTDGVDPIGRARIREIVAGLKDQGVTVFINSHLLMEVEMICDRVVIMSKGLILREGSTAELTKASGQDEFEIDPIPEDLTALLAGVGSELETTDDGFSLVVDDAQRNEAIDRLRGRGVSIRRIVQRKRTLEESFIDAVQEESR